MSRTRTGAPPRTVELELNGDTVEAREDQTILEVAQEQGIEIPTMCWERTLTPVNACRVCVVEVKGARVLVPSCARKVEDGMEIQTHSERVNHSRKMVLEFLASSVDLSVMPNVARWIEEYGADPERYGPPAPPFEAGERDRLRAGHHETPDGRHAATVHQPTKVDNELYVRDYSKCILCYKCVEGCGTDWQNTFAIAVAGRGFDARIATEFANPLPDSACVYCGNCIAVCPTGALMFKSEYDLREEGTWDESRQTQTTTICTYCGVGCNLELHEQDNEIVKVTSPLDHPVTRGNLCIKGRFGFQFIQNHEDEEPPEFLEILERERPQAPPPDAIPEGRTCTKVTTTRRTAAPARSTTRGASPSPAPTAGTTSRSGGTSGPASTRSPSCATRTASRSASRCRPSSSRATSSARSRCS